MTLCKLFFALAFATGFVSSSPNPFNRTLSAWDNPKFTAKYPLLSNAVAKGVQNYNPVRVIEAMRSYQHNLKIITAHRGIFGSGCPENTLCAVDAAINAGIESVEIDVRNDLNGHLWPIHDQRIGRVTNYRFRGYDVFDPYTDPVDFPSNPLISTMKTSDLVTLKTRDSEQNICDDFVDLKTILTYIRVKGNIAVMLDVKTKEAIKDSADLLRSLDMAQSAAIKFLDTLLDPSNSKDMELLDGINFVPVQFLSTQDDIASKRPWWQTARDAVWKYDVLYTQQKSFLNFEVSCKMWWWFLPWSWYPTGPSGFIQAWFRAEKRSVSLGTFIPTPDVPQGFFTNNGICCVDLNSFLATSENFGAETRDDRPNVKAMILTHEILTADDVSQVLTIAEKWNYRKTSYLFQQ